MVTTSPLKSFLLITLLPAIITISSALPNPRPNPHPSPTQKCTPFSPSCHPPWSRPSPSSSPTALLSPTPNLASPIAINTSTPTSATSLSPTETQTQISTSSPTSSTTPLSTSESKNNSSSSTPPPPRSGNERGPPPPPRSGNERGPPPPPGSPPRSSQNSKTHQIVVIALSVSMTLLFLGFALLGFLFVYRKRRAGEDNGNDSFEKAELDSTDCFMRRVVVGSLVSGSSRGRGGNGKGNGGGSKSTTKSAQAPREFAGGGGGGQSKEESSGGSEKESNLLGVRVVDNAEDMEGVEKKRGKGGRDGEKWSFDRSEETLSTSSPREEEHGKWSFDGGEEDSISPVRKEECGGWSFYRSESISTPTTATTACSAKIDREWKHADEEGGKKWSFDCSQETLSASSSSPLPTTAEAETETTPQSEKRDQWKEEEEKRSCELVTVLDKKTIHTLTPTKSHRSNTSHILTPTPSQRIAHNLRIETETSEMQVVNLLQADDLISPLDLDMEMHVSPLNLEHTSTSTSTSTLHPQSQQNHKNIPVCYGGEKMERSPLSTKYLPPSSRASEKSKGGYKHFCPVEKVKSLAAAGDDHQKNAKRRREYGNRERRRRGSIMDDDAEKEMAAMNWSGTKEFESCVGSPPRQKDSGFWSLGDCRGEEELEMEMEMGRKRRGGEDLWDYFITL